MIPTAIAYIGLGSNLGDRAGTIRAALRAMDGRDGLRVLRISTLRETDAVGPAGQPPYLNGVAEVETSLDPAELLDALLGIETALGRVRGIRWGARTIDLDLLLHGDATVDRPGLRVPHPRLGERRFVLEPLAELNPGAAVPGTGLTAAGLLGRLPEEAVR